MAYQNHLLSLLSSAALAVLFSIPASGQSTETVVVNNCRIEALERSSLAAQRAGYIELMSYQPGDSVDRDAVVATLAKQQVELQIAKSQAEYESSTIAGENVWRAEAAKSRQEAAKEYLSLLKQSQDKGGRVSRVEVMEQTSEYRQAKADQLAAVSEQEQAVRTANARRADLKLAELDFAYSSVKAPFAGIISKVLHRRGEYVSLGDPIIELVRMDKLSVVLALSQKDVPPHVVSGAKVTLAITTPSKQAKQPVLNFSGVISGTLPDVERDGRYFAMTQITNQSQRGPNGQTQWILRPGMIGTAIIVLNTSDESENRSALIVRRQ